MRYEPIQLDEAAFVQQQIESLACRKLAAIVLRLDALFPAAQLGLAPQSL